MPSYNKVIIMGNLTRDPEVRYLPSGTAVCDMGLAVNETYKNKEGETVEQTCFVDVVAWAKQAETCAQYLRKGAGALVDGRLQLDQWETKEGEKRSKLRVRADKVQFLSTKQTEAEDEDQRPTTEEEDRNQDDGGFPETDDDELPF